MERISTKQLQEQLRVYFIMGSNNCEKHPFDVLTEAIEGGITFFQFREKGHGALSGAEKVALAKELQAICRKYSIPFLVNDDVELALALDADGVHIGQEDERADIVRRKIGAKILGVSAHNLDEAKRAIEQGADYLGVGPIFPTNTKTDAKEAQGVEVLRHLREQGITIPIVGIGGITADNAKEVIRAGADGVSVISAISLANSPKESAKQLAKAVDDALHEKK
ncbi:thiamine-phosphate pyrophosphorylase [Anoxybacillus voinovskiensis]|uniref:Thiamine-phosphate synthase n=1 Tax=Anoxybacteroides voinovskiense TaxID=230470 RepID=A0A840DXP4_9BACL|nr:thiamine phosphate synthase [Anoxybacillus voinovskiensis]MBB4075277.1 thiamine-phosphate pyrophosphorylase [Anoxybacillus voinovskiensis]GGJ77693.1 thiamine-phosphate synthase [Anoxybacillus voinovskiensis]